MNKILSISAALFVLVGCKSKDVVVFNHVTTNETEFVTFNGSPITTEELVTLAEKVDYGDIDLIVITTNGTERTDLKKLDDGLSDFISYGLSSQDE